MILIRSILRFAIRKALEPLMSKDDPTDHTLLEQFSLEDLKTIYIHEVYYVVSLCCKQYPVRWKNPIKTTADFIGISTDTVERALKKKI